MIEQRPILSTAEWLEWRKLDVTASRVSALPGIACNPYCSPLKLYLEKRGVEFPEPESSVMQRGRWMEPAVRQAVSEKHPQWTIEPAGIYVRDTELRLGATPDFLIRGDKRGLGVLQAKSCARSVFERDWSDGAEVPFWITLQTITEMMLTDASFGAVAVIVVDPFDMQLHIVDVPRHARAEAKVVDAVRAFWADVEAAREPPADFANDTEAIKALAGRDRAGKVFDANGHNMLPEMLVQRADLKALIKAYETRCDEIENEIKYLMREAEKIDGLPGWHVTFKTQDRAGYSVPPKSMRVLRIYDRRPEHEQPQ